MTVATRHAEVSEKFHEHFDVRFRPECIGPDTEMERGVAICFEFDYPDQHGMAVLRRTKDSNPHVPVLMLTTQHSERLAVWAYRNRVLDYLVTPVPERDLLRCKELLLAVQTAVDDQNKRTIIDFKSLIPAEIPAIQRRGAQRLAPALHYVQRNFRRQIRNADMAALCRMSPHHFCRAFTERFSQTFQEYVLRHRIFRACNAFQQPDVPIASVAYSVGFNDPSYFARVFRRYVGLSPSKYREQVSGRIVDRRLSDLIRQLEVPGAETPLNRGHDSIDFVSSSQLIAG